MTEKQSEMKQLRHNQPFPPHGVLLNLQKLARLKRPDGADVDSASGFKPLCQSRRPEPSAGRTYALKLDGGGNRKWLIGMSAGVCSAALSPGKFIKQRERGRMDSGAAPLPRSE